MNSNRTEMKKIIFIGFSLIEVEIEIILQGLPCSSLAGFQGNLQTKSVLDFHVFGQIFQFCEHFQTEFVDSPLDIKFEYCTNI